MVSMRGASLEIDGLRRASPGGRHGSVAWKNLELGHDEVEPTRSGSLVSNEGTVYSNQRQAVTVPDRNGDGLPFFQWPFVSLTTP